MLVLFDKLYNLNFFLVQILNWELHIASIKILLKLLLADPPISTFVDIQAHNVNAFPLQEVLKALLLLYHCSVLGKKLVYFTQLFCYLVCVDLTVSIEPRRKIDFVEGLVELLIKLVGCLIGNLWTHFDGPSVELFEVYHVASVLIDLCKDNIRIHLPDVQVLVDVLLQRVQRVQFDLRLLYLVIFLFVPVYLDVNLPYPLSALHNGNSFLDCFIFK